MTTPGSSPFPIELGVIEFSADALAVFREKRMDPLVCVNRHAAGAWGDVPPAEASANDRAADEGGVLVSLWTLPATGVRVLIVTDADRASTSAAID